MQSIFGNGRVGALTPRAVPWFVAIGRDVARLLLTSGDAVWFALERDDGSGNGVEGVLPQLEAILRFTHELDQHLVAAGVGGLTGAVSLYLRLKTTMDDIPAVDVARTQAAVQTLEHEVGALAQHLAALRRMKGVVVR